jgi:hypothetical protein
VAVGAGETDMADMVRISISPAAFDAIAAIMPRGSVAVEPERNPDGSVGIWLEHDALATLKASRRPAESYSDAILRLAEAGR